jgi:hypothetical protein
MHHAGGAKFQLAGQIAGIPIIFDMGGRVSVTNAAEAVVAAVIDIVRPHGRHPPRAIIYRDSAGMYDAMRIERGEFAGFVIVNGTSDHEAFNKLADELHKAPCRLFVPLDIGDTT